MWSAAQGLRNVGQLIVRAGVIRTTWFGGFLSIIFLQSSGGDVTLSTKVVAIGSEPMSYAVADSYKRPILVCGLLWKPVFNFNLNLIDARCGIR